MLLSSLKRSCMLLLCLNARAAAHAALCIYTRRGKQVYWLLRIEQMIATSNHVL